MKKKAKGITLKEASVKARQICLDGKKLYVDIYMESDDSFSIEKPHDKKAKYHFSVDKSGKRYIKGYKRCQYSGRKYLTYISK